MNLTDFTSLVTEGGLIHATKIPDIVALLLDDANPVEVRADFLRALHLRGETPEEIAGFASELLARGTPFPATNRGCIDVCGTGGDQAHLFNVSTATMFVVASAGVPVVKHGNRGITSKSGGADALEALGIRIDLPPTQAADVLEQAGCCFLFAPFYHPVVKAVVPVRKLLAGEGTPTIFNLLGPLLNPARPNFQLVGLFRRAFLSRYAEALRAMGREAAWVVNGAAKGGLELDEVSTLGTTRVAKCSGNEKISEFTLDPTELGISEPNIERLQSHSPQESSDLIETVLKGRGHREATEIVALNAAAALAVADRRSDLRESYAKAMVLIADGSPYKVLEAMRLAAPPVPA